MKSGSTIIKILLSFTTFEHLERNDSYNNYYGTQLHILIIQQTSTHPHTSSIHTLLLTQGNTQSLIHINLWPTAVLTSWYYITISTVKADEVALFTTLNSIGRSSGTNLR